MKFWVDFNYVNYVELKVDVVINFIGWFVELFMEV